MACSSRCRRGSSETCDTDSGTTTCVLSTLQKLPVYTTLEEHRKATPLLPWEGFSKDRRSPLASYTYSRAMNNHRVRTSSGVTQLFMRRTKTVVMSLQTIKEGHLYKRGKINTEWRMRTFVLNGKQLAYFKGGVSECRGANGCFPSSLSLPLLLLAYYYVVCGTVLKGRCIAHCFLAHFMGTHWQDITIACVLAYS